jgi:NAD(P)-dependent dehydrogenase (short-subunit alcohol dehydrogenase family)
MSRNVVVSGGGTGIGRAVARRFALAGAHVAIIGRREQVIEEAADAVNHEAGRPAVEAVAADLSVTKDVERVGAVVMHDRGAIDVIVNNAGGVGTEAANDLAGVEADWEGEFRRNLLTAVLLTAALEARLRRPGASIVNVSSIAALAGGGDSYSAAKAAVIGWTVDLATRLGPEGIRVNAVVPGYITDTEFFGDRMTEERHARLIGRTLLGRPGDPEDVAAGVFFLASDDAAYITGQLIHINGGALLGR